MGYEEEDEEDGSMGRADPSTCLHIRESYHGGNKPGTCLLPGMCFTFWKEGFYEARQRVTDTERTDL